MRFHLFPLVLRTALVKLLLHVPHLLQKSLDEAAFRRLCFLCRGNKLSGTR